MAIGEPVTVLEGSFMGFKGQVVREAGDQVVVCLNLFGRTTDVTLSRNEVGFPGATLDVLEGEVLEAVARRGFRQRLFYFWEEQAQRSPQLSEPELARQFEAFAAEISREQDAAQAVALARFRTAFESLDVEARNQKWIAERDSWVSYRDEGQQVDLLLSRPTLVGLEGEALSQERRRLGDAAHDLRTQVDAWQRTKGLAAGPVAELRNEGLELQIERDVEADAPFLVYSDWLLSKGNPRGELIALQAAGPARKTAEAALRERLGLQLLGPLSRYGHRLEVQWRLGFLQTLKIKATREDEDEGADVGRLLEAAWRLPSARFLRELSVTHPSSREPEVSARLQSALGAAGVRPTMRSLALVTNEEEEMLSWTSAGELSGNAALFPNLEALEVHAGGYLLTAPSFPRLKSLVLRTCGMTADNLDAVTQAAWPSLERLELWVGSASYGVALSAEQFEPLLRSPRLRRLKSIALCNCELTDALCAALLSSPLLPQLEAICLSKGTMGEVGARLLIDGADRLRHLKTIDVDDNYLSGEVLAELQRALPQTSSTAQRAPDVHDGQAHRYASVGE